MSDPARPGTGILCAGTILVDAGKVIDAYPALDHFATIEQVSLSTGGPGFNMAVDLRMLGAAFPIAMIGAVGDDDHGAFLRAECARLGIDTAGVRTLAGVVTSFTDVMVERDGGRRTMFYHSGANALFDASATDLESCGARILHAGAPGIHPIMDSQLPGGGNGWSALLRRAQAAGLRTNMELISLKPGHQTEVALPCLPYLDSIVINELEAGALTGIDSPVPTADAPVDWPAAGGDGARPDRARGVGARGGALPGGLRCGRPRRPDLAAGLRPAAPRPGTQHDRRRRRLRRRSHPGPLRGLAGRTLPAAGGRVSRGVRAWPGHLGRHQARGCVPRRSRRGWLPSGPPAGN